MNPTTSVVGQFEPAVGRATAAFRRESAGQRHIFRPLPFSCRKQLLAET